MLQELLPHRLLAALLAASIATNGVLLVRLSRPDALERARGWLVRPAPPSPTDHARGGARATTVLVYADFECPFCARFHEAMRPLTASGRVRLVYRHLPLTSIHARAVAAAEASECAAEQSRFWEFADRLYALPGGLAGVRFTAVAADVGLDTLQFAECTRTGRYAARVRAQMREAERLGLRATPTYFIHGRRYEGFVAVDTLRAQLGARERTRK